MSTKVQGKNTKPPRKSYNTQNLTNAGKGRPKGVQNKTTALLKDAILQAAQNAGGKDGMIGYLTTQAEENPAAFMTLLGKVLPLQINGGEDEHGLPKAIEVRYISAKDRPLQLTHAPILNVEHNNDP
jgi:hypothetical protein